MLRFRPADMGDIHAVFADLSEISTDEVMTECGNWWSAMTKVRELFALPDAHTEALVDEAGTALAIFGHYSSKDPYIRTTWFVFSNRFMARGLAVALACRRRAQELLAGYPGTDFHSYTLSDHPSRDRWFALLGFRLAMTTLDGAHRYVLVKTSDLWPVGKYNPTNPRAS